MWLLRAVVTIAIVLLSSFQTFSQEVTRPVQAPRGDEVLRFERIADVPENVLNAIRKAGCGVDDRFLQQTPVLAFRPVPGAGG